jgi:quercetin dioxygenase-like cupin family protein
MGPTNFTIKATAEDTGGEFYLAETTVEAGFPGPPPHTHERLTDMFYVLEGTLTLHVDGEESEAGPGSFACFPPGVVHTFANRSDAPARFLNFSTPGGFEGYMRSLAEAMETDSFTPELVTGLADEYDIQVV